MSQQAKYSDRTVLGIVVAVVLLGIACFLGLSHFSDQSEKNPAGFARQKSISLTSFKSDKNKDRINATIENSTYPPISVDEAKRRLINMTLGIFPDGLNKSSTML